MNSSQPESAPSRREFQPHRVHPERVLVVEDDPEIHGNVREILEGDGYQVDVATSLEELRRRGDWTQFAAVLLDRILPDGTTDGLLPEIRRHAPDTAIIVVTVYKDVDSAVAAVHHGAADYLTKPINVGLLRARIRRAMQLRRFREKMARLTAIVESATDAIVGTTLDGVITDWNTGAAEIFGYSAEQAIGCNVLMLHPDGHQGEMSKLIDTTARGEAAADFESVWVRSDGRTVHTSVSLSAVRAPSGTVIGVSYIARDTSQRKESEERLRAAEQLAFLGQMVTTVSHEGRNALQRIYARAEMLKRKLTEHPEAFDDVERISLACDDLHKLQEDILTFATPVKPRHMRCSLPEIWNSAWGQLRSEWADRDARLSEELHCAEFDCEIDRDCLLRVFRSLFKNSLAACEDPVRIMVECTETVDEQGQLVQIRVSDNGPGLSTEQRSKMFQPFFTTKLHGTGLGLAIARKIIEAHGGTMTLGDGQGTEFFVAIPRNSRSVSTHP